MTDLENLGLFATERPVWSAFGSASDFDSLPEAHRAQIIFLDKKADTYLGRFIDASGLISGEVCDPFSKKNFKTIEKFSLSSDSDIERNLKKWLYRRCIPFSTQVFVFSQDPFLATWKMIIKYCGDLFFNDDVIVFDKTLNWCLFYFHHDQLFFGKDHIYDGADDDKKMREINELKRKHPQFKFPY